MNELVLSLMQSEGYDPEKEIRPLLDQFESEHRCRVQVRIISWETGRDELVKIALHGKGADISEIGSTWCSSYISMEALRPFTAPELSSLGGSSAFFPSSWKSGQLFGSDRQWAIPWLAAIRVLYYRRDLLEKAGIDEKTAFGSSSQLAETLKCLQASGIPIPLVLATRNVVPPVLHSLASWIWGAGGDFVSKDGTEMLLNQPETRAGIRAFFKLGQFLAPEARGLNLAQAEARFWQGDAAVSLSWQAPILASIKKNADPKVLANLGVTTTPGVTFIGGSNLVIWRHVAHAQEALAVELVRFLTSQQVQSAYNTKIGYFPTRPDVIQNPPFSNDVFHQILMDGLNSGRSFPAISRWAIVEDRFIHLLGQLWDEVLADPNPDIDAIISNPLDQLCKRLNNILQPI
jgi:ABC-type glycerol-3-phosphate transport system substrate-binding protein